MRIYYETEETQTIAVSSMLGKYILVVLIPGAWGLLSIILLLGSVYFVTHYKVVTAATTTANANYSIYLAQPKSANTVTQTYAAEDSRSAIIDNYFKSQGAPLYGYGNLLVTTADKYGLDWRLLPAIAMQESNGGKVMPRDSYNAWGWAIYTGQNSGKYFDTWEDAIETVAKGLAVYRSKYNLSTPEQIMTLYTPDSLQNGGTWATGVRFFMSLFGTNYL